MTGFMEYPEAAEWITGLLTGTPIAGVTAVQEHPAQELSTFPLITFSQQAPSVDVMVINGNRVWSELVFLVTAIAKGESTKALKAIATEIDARLHRASGTSTDGRILESVRTGGFQASELDNGVQYRRLGGFYQLIVQPTNP